METTKDIKRFVAEVVNQHQGHFSSWVLQDFVAELTPKQRASLLEILAIYMERVV